MAKCLFRKRKRSPFQSDGCRCVGTTKCFWYSRAQSPLSLCNTEQQSVKDVSESDSRTMTRRDAAKDGARPQTIEVQTSTSRFGRYVLASEPKHSFVGRTKDSGCEELIIGGQHGLNGESAQCRYCGELGTSFIVSSDTAIPKKTSKVRSPGPSECRNAVEASV